MQLSSHLVFNGQCEAAFRFYEKALGGKINVLMTWGDSPMAKNVPADWTKKIMHVSMTVGDRELTGGDSPDENYQKPQGFYVTLNLKESIDAERLFVALSEKGNVQMLLQETFWATRFGMLIDQFGIPWMINSRKL